MKKLLVAVFLVSAVTLFLIVFGLRGGFSGKSSTSQAASRFEKLATTATYRAKLSQCKDITPKVLASVPSANRVSFQGDTFYQCRADVYPLVGNTKSCVASRDVVFADNGKKILGLVAERVADPTPCQ